MAMNRKLNILLVYKKSRLEVYEDKFQTDPHIQELETSHQTHLRCINDVTEFLREQHIPFTSCYRGDLNQSLTKNKFVITVGGDGTLLDASHAILHDDLLGINSDPERSVGSLCAATADNFKDVLSDIIAGRLQPQKIMRLKATLNGSPLPVFALNELLIAHHEPAATSRYVISVGEMQEEQMSSGIWIATPAGSTGAILSAGGKRQTMNDCCYQFKVREPYFVDKTHPQLLEHMLECGIETTIVCKMLDGMIYCDGPYSKTPFPFGSTLQISGDGLPLSLFTNSADETRRKRMG